MPPQLLFPGIPLMKAAGVPAMDPDCCCCDPPIISCAVRILPSYTNPDGDVVVEVTITNADRVVWRRTCGGSEPTVEEGEWTGEEVDPEGTVVKTLILDAEGPNSAGGWFDCSYCFYAYLGSCQSQCCVEMPDPGGFCDCIDISSEGLLSMRSIGDVIVTISGEATPLPIVFDLAFQCPNGPTPPAPILNGTFVIPECSTRKFFSFKLACMNGNDYVYRWIAVSISNYAGVVVQFDSAKLVTSSTQLTEDTIYEALPPGMNLGGNPSQNPYDIRRKIIYSPVLYNPHSESFCNIVLDEDIVTDMDQSDPSSLQFHNACNCGGFVVEVDRS